MNINFERALEVLIFFLFLGIGLLKDSLVDFVTSLQLNFVIFILMIFLPVLIELIFVISEENSVETNSVQEFIKKFHRWCHDNIHNARHILITAMLIAIFGISYQEFLEKNNYINYIFFLTISGGFTLSSIAIIYVVSNYLEKRDSILEIGAPPSYLFTSITLISIPMLFMLSHKKEFVILTASYAIAIGLYLNIKWLQNGLIKKYSPKKLLKEVLMAFLVTIVSYMTIPIINEIGREIVKTGRCIIDDNQKYNEYINYYNIIINNFNLIEKNIKLLKKDTKYLNTRRVLIQQKIDKCLNVSNRILRRFENIKSNPTVKNVSQATEDTLKDFTELKQDIEILKINMKNLRTDPVFDSMQKNIILIDNSIEIINSVLNKIRNEIPK